MNTYIKPRISMTKLTLAIFVAYVSSIAGSTVAEAPVFEMKSNDDSFLLSKDGRAFAKIDPDDATVEIFCSHTPFELWGQVQFPSNDRLLQFCVSDTFESASFLTDSALFFASRQDKRIAVAKTNVNFPLDSRVRLMSAIDNAVLLERQGQILICSTDQTASLYKVPKPFWIAATSAKGTFVLTPAEGRESDLFAFRWVNQQALTVGKLTGFGTGRGCLPYAKSVAVDGAMQVIVAVVERFEALSCPKGDALFVWSGGSLLDVSQVPLSFFCVAIAVNNDVVQSILRSKEPGNDGLHEMRSVAFSVSLSRGLINKRDNFIASVSHEDQIQISPGVGTILCVSENGRRLRAWSVTGETLHVGLGSEFGIWDSDE